MLMPLPTGGTSYPVGTCGHNRWGTDADGHSKCKAAMGKQPYDGGDAALQVPGDDQQTCCKNSTTADGTKIEMQISANWDLRDHCDQPGLNARVGSFHSRVEMDGDEKMQVNSSGTVHCDENTASMTGSLALDGEDKGSVAGSGTLEQRGGVELIVYGAASTSTRNTSIYSEGRNHDTMLACLFYPTAAQCAIHRTAMPRIS